MNVTTSSVISECEMASAILVAMNFYVNHPTPDPSVKESLLFATLNSLERATNLIKTELMVNSPQ